jgi:diaminohydroxyphosphoribosylaminopyrimidine deaminase/5-amino-6-(5-phosphoribosylamino)uracil reductase
MMNITENYMRRCLELAQLGVGFVAPNPMVGAVLVHGERIIGEGYHQKYGASHAEVNCINSVKKADQHLVSASTLYVSLEPCAHFGKTPPCSQLIIKHQIPKVVIACRDPFAEVNGKGIAQLKAAGIEVLESVLEKEALGLNKQFILFHQQKRPYIILKWAETANGKIARLDDQRLMISNEFVNRLVHQWRSETAAIMVGTNTAKKDNPKLDTRLWTGPNPIRMVIDNKLELSADLNLLDGTIPTIVWNGFKNEDQKNLHFKQLDPLNEFIPQILSESYKLGIQSILVEGGAKLLQSFIDTGFWDEVRVIKNESMILETNIDSLDAPKLLAEKWLKTTYMLNNSISYYQKKGDL